MLDPEALIAVARHRTGIGEAAGDGAWRRRLDILAEELEGEAALTPLGRTIAHGQLVAAIAQRLRARALWRRYPQILDRPVARPILIVGQMRSGSTRMQRLLACDPRLAHTRFYESWRPLPSLPFDERPLRAALALVGLRLLNPGFAAIHPTGTFQPDEEYGLFGLSLFGAALEAQWRIPAFARHCEDETDREGVYGEFKAFLQTLAWLRREPPQRRQILKVPQFMQDLDVLLRVFPDAQVIRLRRDPATIVASSASLVRNQMELQAERVDPRWIGREWLGKTALREARTEAALAGANVSGVTVDYDAMSAAWLAEAERIYAALGLTLTAEVRARMTRFVGRSRPARRRPHRYALADFGLSQGAVAHAMDRDVWSAMDLSHPCPSRKKPAASM